MPMPMRPTDLLPAPPDYGIDITDIASHHSLPDMIHRFPTAAEYERLNRKREKRKRRIVIAVAVLGVSILIAFMFPNNSNKKKGNASDSVVDHNGFSVVNAVYLPSIQAGLVVYFHKKTHTEILTLVPDDVQQDSVFGISFRTLPESDNGAAHIVMRSVLDGSKKYPLKDPMEELRRGSLQTYLQQFIRGDRTVFACATRNSKDFANLVAVHLDAVFNPNVVQEGGNWMFRQEAWRLEKLPRNDAHGNQQHRFNGVVLETQKGAYSDPDVSIYKYAHRALFPDTQYQYDNEGFPADILSMTRDDLITYHRKFYHPSNAQVFLYGRVEDVTEALDQVDNYVGTYDLRDDIKQQSSPQWQDKIFPDNAPREVHEYPATLDNADYRVLMCWLINDHQLDPKTEIAWRMLNYLLMESPTAKLRENLEFSGQGRQVIGQGLKTELLQYTFSVGMKGVKREDVAKVEDIILTSLNQIEMNGGFPTDDLQAAFNTVEFQLTDHATGKYPRGISLLFSTLSVWTYGREPEIAFDFHQGISELIEEVKTNGSAFFMTLLRDNLINNHHKVIVQLFPDTTYVATQASGDQDRIDLLRKSLSDDGFFALLDETGEMILKQKFEDPSNVIDTIPHLAVSDIDPISRPNTIKLRIDSDMLVAETIVESSFGIHYIDFGLDLGNVDLNDVPLIPLMARLFMEAGTKLWSQEQLDIAVGKDSGGIYTQLMVEGVRPKISDSISFVVTDETHFATKFFFRGKCLADKLPQYFELLGQIVWFGAKFNQGHTLEILKDMVEILTENVGKNGDEFVSRRIEARYSKYGLIRERLAGVTSLQQLIDALGVAKDDWDTFSTRLEKIRSAIVEGHRNGMVLSLTGESDLLAASQSTITMFIKDIVPVNDHATPFTHPSTDNHPWVPQIRVEQDNMSPIIDEGIAFPETVNHVGKGAKLYEISEPIVGAASVVAKFLQDGYLHEVISIEGGAADVHCRVDYRSGTLKFTSYRDPNIAKTLGIFEEASVFLGQQILTSDTLPVEAVHAIVGTIADLDGSAPQPDEIGWDFLTEYIREDTSDFRQLWRDEILNTSRADFVQFIDNLANWADPSIAVVASKEAIARANRTYGIKLINVDITVN